MNSKMKKMFMSDLFFLVSMSLFAIVSFPPQVQFVQKGEKKTQLWMHLFLLVFITQYQQDCLELISQ